MATVNFNVPEEVETAFNKAFEGRNESAVIAGLKREAVERVRRKQRSRETIERALHRRRRAPAASGGGLRIDAGGRASMIAVVAAGAALKWFYHEPADEPRAERAIAVPRDVGAGRSRMVQPPHFLAEVAAVLARKKPETAARADPSDLQLLEWESVESPAICATAIDLSIHPGRHLFDTVYHATAMHTEGATLITADDSCYDKARHRGRIIRLKDL